MWWFQADRLRITGLCRLSAEWFNLTLLVDYEDHNLRTKGLLKALGGKADHCEFAY